MVKEESRSVEYQSLLSVKLSNSLMDNLDKIKIFEHRKLSELVREWLTDKVEGYYKRPDFRHFLKDLEERRAKRLSGS